MKAQQSTAEKDFTVTNAMVFSIALPMTLAFLTTPLLGIVDTAVVGQFGDAALIGGLAVGAVIFDIVFTTFNFLRTGTTGFVAQAVGRKDAMEQQAIFWRALIMAVCIGLVFLPLSPLLQRFGLYAMAPGDEVARAAATYMAIRFLATPFTLVNYALLGVLLGQGRAVSTLFLQALINASNIALSIALGLWLEWNVAGVAWATVIAESVVAIGAFVWIKSSFNPSHAPSWARIFDRAAFVRIIVVNRDIMIRSFALLATFFLFTRFGAQFGEQTLAANAILLNFFLVAAYFLDGLSAASEQLVGRALGAQAKAAFWQVVRKTSGFGFALSFTAAGIILFYGQALIARMTTAEGVVAEAALYLPWAALTAPLGVLAFQMDGVYLGATWSVPMRNMMLLALASFIGLSLWLMPNLGNNGLWLAFNIWLAIRGVSLLALLPGKVRQTFS